MARLNGADAIIEVLQAEGITHIFGNPGTTESSLLDSLAGHPDINFVLGLHENVVLGMAGGYAISTGKAAVCLVHTSYGTASGFLNLLNAQSEQLPIVVLAGQQHTSMLLSEPSLAFNLHGSVKEVSKWSWEIRNLQEIPSAVRRAIKVALEPPSGPTFLILPSNIAAQETEFGEFPSGDKFHFPYRSRGDPEAIARAASLLLKAERPCLIYGSSAVRSGAVPEIIELAELLSIEVYAAPRFPILAFPTKHPLYMGVFDRTASQSADLIIGIGLKMFREHEYMPMPLIMPGTSIIHMDSNVYELAKNYPLDVGIVADPKAGVQNLMEAAESLIENKKKSEIRTRAERIANVREKLNENLKQEVLQDWESSPIKTTRLVIEIRKAMDQSGIIVEEAIRSTRALEKHFRIYEPGTFIRSTGGLGWSLSASIGVKLGLPKRQVLAYIGDGSFMYAPQALWTMARYKLPIVIVICNNKSYVSQKAILFQMGRFATRTGKYIGTDLDNPEIDFVGLGKSLGVPGSKVEKPDEIGPALRNAFSSESPYIIDAIIDPKQAGPTLSLP